MTEEETKSERKNQGEYIRLGNLLMELGQKIGRGEVEAIYKQETVRKPRKEDKYITE